MELLLSFEYIALFLSMILLFLEALNTTKTYFIKTFLWNILIIYVCIYYTHSIHLLYLDSINLKGQIIFQTVHHLCSLLLSFGSCIYQFYTFEISLCLFLHYFKNIIVFNYLLPLYTPFCIIYNFSYLGIIYRIYKWKKFNKIDFQTLILFVVIVLIQFNNNFAAGYLNIIRHV
jgi:hypothetical protein